MKLMGKCLALILLPSLLITHEVTIFSNNGNGWSITKMKHPNNEDHQKLKSFTDTTLDDFFQDVFEVLTNDGQQTLKSDYENELKWWDSEKKNELEDYSKESVINVDEAQNDFKEKEEGIIKENQDLVNLELSENAYEPDSTIKLNQLSYSSSPRYYSAHFRIKYTGEEGKLTAISTDSDIYKSEIIQSGPICNLSITQNKDSKCNSLAVIVLVDKVSQASTAYQVINALAVIFREDSINYNAALFHPEIPSFSVSYDNFQLLSKLDITFNSNQLVELNYDPTTNFGWLSSFMLCFSGITIALVIAWIIYIHWYASSFYIQLQRYYNILPYLIGLIAFGIYLEVDSSVGGETSTNWLGVLGLMTKLITKLSIIVYKTFFWILLILVSYGYLTFNFVNRNSFFFIFTIVYLGFLSEIVINNIFMLKDVWDMISVTFLKSSIFYICYSVLCIRKTMNVLSKINVEYLNMIIDDNNLVESILLKVFMLKVNLVVVISYTILYIFGGFVLTLTYKDSSNPVISVFFFILDLTSLAIILFFLRPRELLSRYDGTNIEFEEYSHIYRACISNKKLQGFYEKEEREMMSLNMTSIEVKDTLKEDELIIVLNPLYAEISEDKSGLSMIDNTISFKKLQKDFDLENTISTRASILEYNHLLDSIVLGSIAKS